MKKISTAIAAVCLVTGAYAAELNLTPGALPAEVARLAAGTDPTLKLSGEVTAGDLLSLGSLPRHITDLDMSALSVKGCTVADGGRSGQTEFADGELPAYLLFGTSVRNVTIPQSTVRIGDGAFASTPIETIDLRHVSEIGEALFLDCRKLKTVEMSGTSVAAIPARLFSGCRSLVSVSLPSGIRTVGQRAFINSGIYSISLNEAVEIGDYAFAEAHGLTEISFPAGCRLGEGVFWGDTSLETVTGNPGNTPALYAGNSGLSVHGGIVPGPVIPSGAFAGSSVGELLLGADVVKVEPHAFYNLAALHAMDVTALGASVPETSPEAFLATDIASAKLYVLEGEADVWKQAPVWREFQIQERASTPGLPSSVTDISVRRDGHLVYVAAGVKLSEVTLYSLDGKILSSFEPEGETCMVTIPEGNEIVVVRATGGGMIKVVKLKK